VVFDEAENRMHAQKALMLFLLTARAEKPAVRKPAKRPAKAKKKR
jgi:hypothetical protein